jgi:ATP-binding cassette subfamily B protein
MTACLIKLIELIIPVAHLKLIKRLLLENWRTYALRYGIAFLFMFIVATCTGLSAWLMKDVVNLIFVERRADALFWIPAVVIVIFLAKGFASYFQELSITRIGHHIVAEEQKKMFATMLAQDVAFYHRYPSSDLIVLITQNAQAARTVISLIANNLGRDLMTLGGLIAVMAVQQPVLFSICLLAAPIGAFIQRGLIKSIQAVGRSEIFSTTHVVRTMRETSQGMRVIKAFNLENAMRDRMQNAVNSVERLANRLVSVTAGVNPLVDVLGGVAVAAVIFYAGWYSLSAGEAPGEFFSFLTALLMAYEPVRRLGRVHIQLAQACVGLEMMYQLKDIKVDVANNPDLPKLEVSKGEVRFSGVNFGYTTDTNVLNDLNLVAEPGKTTALVGLSGSGKSTIMNLILRFWDPSSGIVSIDNVNIRNVYLTSLRKQIALVSQDVFLFDGTVRENIALGMEDANETDIIAAAKAAAAHQFITGFPEGYDTQVGELGSQLSGGQRQRIAIARAFLKNASIVLLDEPTAALDSVSEQAIQRSLAQLTKSRTTIVIAHRLSTVLKADRILVIDNGRVVESGSHQELLASEGLYARLYNIQFAPAEYDVA